MYSLAPEGYYVAPELDKLLHEFVEPGYYSVAFNPDRGCFYLAPAQPFTLVSKIYGNAIKHSPRILDTFFRRKGINTAAAFEGVKGSGKTLLMKHICKTFVEEHQGIILIVNTPFSGDAFNSFIQSITQSKVVVFDEFEKVYHKTDDRNKILTLLDGTYSSHTLFLITTNTDMYNNASMEFFSNRPGRVYFNIRFSSVDLEAITEYCIDHLADQKRLKDIQDFICKFDIFNMDMLSVLVTEINLNPSMSIEELSEFLNIKPDIKISNISCTFKCYYKGTDVTDSTDHCLTAGRLDSFITYGECWNIYNMLEESDNEENTTKEVINFDIYLDPSSASVEQNKTTRVITIEQGDIKLLITPAPLTTMRKKHRVTF